MEALLTKLKLSRIKEVYPDWIKKATEEEISYYDFLKSLLEEEVCARYDNRMKRSIKQAKFPYHRTIEQFDFTFRPDLKKRVIQGYMNHSFIQDSRSLVLIGAAGLGKTHLAVSIGLKMIHLDYKVKFITAQDLLNKYATAEDLVSKNRVLKPFLSCDLLILDELGYLPYDKEAAPAFYQLIAGRYEKKATIITSNKGLSEWGSVLHDYSLASAIVDRLMHYGDIFHLKGESYRLVGKRGF
jgi:DNA replication protein DnaC